MNWKVIFEKGSDGRYTVTAPSLPGCISQGKTKVILTIALIIILIIAGATTYFYFPQSSDPDVPYSFLAVHFEIDPNSKEATDIWQNMVTMVDLANQYNVPLTIMFWPGSVEYALSSSERLAKVREWQSQGHEIGLHNQGCFNPAINSIKEKASLYAETDNAIYEQLAGNYEIKSGTNAYYCSWMIPSFKYEGGGRPDGRSALAIKHEILPGHEVYGLNIKAGYAGGTWIKIAQYNTLNKNEIYGFVDHGEGDAGNLGGTKELKEWLTFLYEKDPTGEKRMTLRDIMEKYVLPNNLVASMKDICSSIDSRTQQCLSLAIVSTKSGSSANCINPYDTGAFNFGRCLQTGTYCELESGLSEEQLCSISRGDFYTYVPTSCVVKSISEYESMEYCPSSKSIEKDADIETKTDTEVCPTGQTLCAMDEKCSGTGTKTEAGICCTGTCSIENENPEKPTK